MNRFHEWYCSSARWRTTLQERLLPWAVGAVPLGDHVCEVGSGPGLATDWLRTRVVRVTAVEVDGGLARGLHRRSRGSGVRVLQGDGARLPLRDASVSSVVSFTMLHHVPTPAAQSRLVGEAFRVLRPGCWFLGSDSRPSLLFRLAHLGDTMTLVDPDAFRELLERTGFTDVSVKAVKQAFAFRGRRP